MSHISKLIDRKLIAGKCLFSAHYKSDLLFAVKWGFTYIEDRKKKAGESSGPKKSVYV